VVIVSIIVVKIVVGRIRIQCKYIVNIEVIKLLNDYQSSYRPPVSMSKVYPYTYPT